MRHRFGKGVIGLVAGLAAICLMSLPASANTATIEFIHSTTGTPGAITVINADGETVTSVPLGSTTTPTCSTSSTTVTVTVTGTTPSAGGSISIALSNCSAFVQGTTRWCSTTTGTFTGAWTHGATSANTYTSTATSITVVLRKDSATAPTHNCHAVETGTCTLVVGPLTVNGPINSTTLPALAVSNTATANGSSDAETLTVTGTAANCGVFIGGNNGSVSISAHVHVTSVP
jgi:hypothetical protein